MRAKSVPLGGASGTAAPQTFIHKGTNGRWRDMLTRGGLRGATREWRAASSARNARNGWLAGS